MSRTTHRWSSVRPPCGTFVGVCVGTVFGDLLFLLVTALSLPLLPYRRYVFSSFLLTASTISSFCLASMV